MIIDFNHGGNNPSGKILKLIDDALVKKSQSSQKRDYLGASMLGKCQRYLCYYATNTPVDDGKELGARTLRIFYRGHQGEDWVAQWFRTAGFSLKTQNNLDEQFGFSLDQLGRCRGHIDGVFLNGPNVINYPCLWENKVLGAKTYRKLEREGCKLATPDYYSQIMIYSAYMKLHDNPIVFTALNADTMDIYIELIPFDGEEAQAMSDKAVNVIKAVESGQILPRPYSKKDYFVCKWCDYQEHCWTEDGD